MKRIALFILIPVLLMSCATSRVAREYTLIIHNPDQAIYLPAEVEKESDLVITDVRYLWRDDENKWYIELYNPNTFQSIGWINPPEVPKTELELKQIWIFYPGN